MGRQLVCIYRGTGVLDFNNFITRLITSFRCITISVSVALLEYKRARGFFESGNIG